ncbi:unnamed protein product [Schistosoma curassoni]|uniref:Velvet domain-containing protein n=1 Tax=Schistosoma curassoni TaxID=6186 RepID=A0A183JLA1_9TREM|nr:unnamed protein product [Schistosoma curassoni]
MSTSNNHQTNENFTTHSRSNTPTNTVYTNNATINSSPLNNPQYANYIPKDNLQQQHHQQQPQMKISSPQSSSCLLGNDSNVVQHSSNPPSQPSMTISQQNHRRSHIPANTNISVHQSSQITQQQSQLCPPRSVFWEGEIHVADPNGMSMTNRFPLRLLLEQCAVRDVRLTNHISPHTGNSTRDEVGHDQILPTPPNTSLISPTNPSHVLLSSPHL